uniref:Uncharacterized protein n=1 Tax=Solanum lycopersicum TaxID=4081 RepID=A0A3Q7G7R8_SOLLC
MVFCLHNFSSSSFFKYCRNFAFDRLRMLGGKTFCWIRTFWSFQFVAILSSYLYLILRGCVARRFSVCGINGCFQIDISHL